MSVEHMPMYPDLYIFRWSRYLGMDCLEGKRKGQTCQVLRRGARNSCLVRFTADGFKAVVSRNALMRDNRQLMADIAIALHEMQ